MKFLVKNKKEGYKIKEQVVKIANEWDYVFLSDILMLFDRVPDPSAYEYAWPSDYVKNGKIQVREYKESWFVYIFGEPKKVNKKDPLPNIDVTVFETETFEKLIDELTKLRSALNSGLADIMFAIDSSDTGFRYRNCMVKAKKSGRKEERQDRPAIFHRWADLSKGVQQVVAIVEFGDGHVEQVQPDRVVFKEVERSE